MKIVAFYTPNYADLAMQFVENVRKFGHKIFIKQYADRGTWQKNTRIKSEFLLECARKFNGEDLLYLDVDSEIVQKFDIYNDIDENTDIAMIQERFPYNPTFNEMVSCTIFIRANDGIVSLFDKWVKMCRETENSRILEQRVLQNLIEESNEIKFTRLPIEYGFIFDTCRRMYQDAQPYIVEYQASRKRSK